MARTEEHPWNTFRGTFELDARKAAHPVFDGNTIPHLFQFMLHGSLDEAFTTEPLRMNPTWRLALSWLASISADIPLGRYNLFGQSMFALVQEYETLPPAACRFESHREHVDLQFTLTGVESIDWIPRSTLKPDGEFNLDHDVGFWLPPSEPVTTLIQFPRRFSVFYPADAHRPKGRMPGTEKVRKLVIKVPVKMVG